MTLSTDVIILDPVDRDELYKFCDQMVRRSSDVEQSTVSRHEVSDKSINNSPGQGLSAWLSVSANQDGTAVFSGAPGHETYCDEECTSWRCTVPYFAKVNFDTSYGYCGPLNETCSMLHMNYILLLAQWAKQRNVRIEWINEYTGTIHEADDMVALSDFVGTGDQTNDWFRNVVIPFIVEYK